METQKDKKIKISFFWSLIGGVFFSVFMLPSSFLNLKELLITVGVFMIGIVFFAWLIYWFNQRPKNNQVMYFLILILSLLIFIIIFYNGYKLGFVYTLFYSFFGFLFVVLIDLFLLFKPEKMIRNSFIFLVIIVIMYVFAWNYGDFINSFNCQRRSGFFGGMGVCYPNETLLANKKNIFGVTINIPEHENQQAIMRYRIGKKLSGTIKNFETGKIISGKVIAYPEKIIKNSSRFNFIMPFEVDNKDEKIYSYLGFFSFPEKTMEAGYYFYKNIDHIDSFLLGENISLGETKIKIGLYNNLLIQEYFELGERREIKVRVDGYLNKFYLDKDCEEIGEIVEKTRGDGKKYKVCIMEDNKMCELEHYKKGDCPSVGFDVSKFSEIETYCVLTGNYLYKGGCSIPEKDISCDLNDYFNGECN